jgi:hypothetical protein
MSFPTAVFVQLVEISEKEEHVMQYHKHERWRRLMRHWGAVVIQRVWRLHQTLRRMELRRSGYTPQDIEFLGKTALCRRNPGVESGAGNGRGLVAGGLHGKRGGALCGGQSVPMLKWAMCDAMSQVLIHYTHHAILIALYASRYTHRTVLITLYSSHYDHHTMRITLYAMPQVQKLRKDPPEWLFLNESVDELGELTHDVMQVRCTERWAYCTHTLCTVLTIGKMHRAMGLLYSYTMHCTHYR